MYGTQGPKLLDRLLLLSGCANRELDGKQSSGDLNQNLGWWFDPLYNTGPTHHTFRGLQIKFQFLLKSQRQYELLGQRKHFSTVSPYICLCRNAVISYNFKLYFGEEGVRVQTAARRVHVRLRCELGAVRAVLLGPVHCFGLTSPLMF